MYTNHQDLMDIWSQQSYFKKFDLHLCCTLQAAACLVFLWWQQIKALWNRSYLLPVNNSGSLKERASKTWGLLTKRSFLCCNKNIRKKTKRIINIHMELNGMCYYKKIRQKKFQFSSFLALPTLYFKVISYEL